MLALPARALGISLLSISLLSTVAFLMPQTSEGAIITVRQDGTGDFDNLTAAIAAANPTDSIAIGPGTYAEGATLHIDVALTLFSTDGPEVTRIDGENAYRILETTSAGIRFEGLQFSNGRAPGSYPTGAGAALMWPGSQVTMVDCVIRGHVADWGGAIYVTNANTGSNTTLDAQSCVFENNLGTETAGAVYVVNGAVGTFSDCTVAGNEAGLRAGAIHIIRAVGHFERCSFSNNRSGDIAGAIYFEDSAGSLRESTFYDHTSPGPIAGTVVVQLSHGTNVTRNIFSGDTDGVGLRYYLGVDAHSCNVYWNNADGPIGGTTLDPTEVVADPLFCDPLHGDFTLASTSPAAPASSPCGQLIGAFPVACSSPGPSGAPRIDSIADVPGDDGGQVRIRWERSGYDAPSQPYVITGYGIYRQAPLPGAAVLAAESRDQRAPGLALDGWDYVATVPARGDAIYQYVAPTLCDSHHNQTCWSVFFVSAMTADPLTFFDSPPDSGFSTDDLPPAPPFNLHASPTALGTEVRWDAPEDAVAAYHVYRGTGDFEMLPAALVGTTAETVWLDADNAAPAWSYKVTALDVAGNESEAAFWNGSTTDAPSISPLRYALHGNEPNPFNPMTTIYFDVPSGGGRVALRIYDVRGNLVRTLLDRFEPVGSHRGVTWNALNDAGSRVASGVYFCRLQASSFDQSVRMVLIE